jgi:hypothetical protein
MSTIPAAMNVPVNPIVSRATLRLARRCPGMAISLFAAAPSPAPPPA